MAINAYSGARSQSITAAVSVTGHKGSTSQTIYLSDKIGQLQPMLRTPNILDLISNNHFTGGDSSEMVNLRFYWNMKSGAFELLSDETGTIKSGESLVADETPVLAKQIGPVSYGKKIKGEKRDLELQGLENVVAVKIADTILNFRDHILIGLLKKAYNAAITTQALVVAADPAAITFEKGAHYVTYTYTTATKLYEELKNAVSEFLRMGMESAITKYNQEIEYMYGCRKSDLLILIDEKIAGDLFSLPGLWSSNNAFTELFKNGEFKDFLGVAIMPTPWLPAGTNFMIMTMGSPYGALHYSLCGELVKSYSGETARTSIGSTVIVKDNPNWGFGYMIDFMENYRADVLLPDLIWVSSRNPSTALSKEVNVFNAKKTSKEDIDIQIKNHQAIIDDANVNISKLNHDLKNKSKSLDPEQKKEIEKNISTFKKIIDKHNKKIEGAEKHLEKKE